MILQSQVRELAQALDLEARGLSQAVIAGMHLSRKAGEGAEFAEFDAYRPGDDVRNLDWRRLVRTGEAVVRRHESERRMGATLLLDWTGSMDFGESAHKGRRAALLALAVVHAHLRLGDRVLMVLMGGEEELRIVPLRAGEDGTEEASHLLISEPPKGKVPMARGLEQIESEVQAGAPMWVLGDFLEQGDWESPLARCRERGADLRTAWIGHPDEIELPYKELTRFEGLESQESLVLDPLALAASYRQAFDEHRRGIATRCRALGAAHLDHITDSDPATELMAWSEEAHQR